MSGTKSFKGSRKAELYGSLFRSLNECFGGDNQELSLYQWLKDHVTDGRDFLWSGMNLADFMRSHTKEIMRRVDGISRGKLPWELADEDD